MYRYRIHVGPTGVRETVIRLDDANQSTAHLGSFQNIVDGTEHVSFDRTSGDVDRVKRDLREVLGYVPLTVTKRELWDGMNMPLATRRQVNAHRTDVLALAEELEKAANVRDWQKVDALIPLVRLVGAEMGRTTGATAELPENWRGNVTQTNPQPGRDYLDDHELDPNRPY